MRLALLVLLTCGSLFTPAHTFATTSPPPHFERHLTVRDGLSNSAVTALHQDHLGFLWVGTRDGLNRFDGYEFIPFLTRASTSACAGTIFDLAETDDGRLWVATPTGIAYLSPGQEQFVCLDGPALGLPAQQSTIFDLTVAPNNRIWAATASGLLTLSLDDVNQAEATLHHTDSNVTLTRVLHHPMGALWVADQNGTLFQYLPETGQLVHISQPETQQGMALFTLALAPDEHIWILGQGLLRAYDPMSNTWSNILFAENSPSTWFVSADFTSSNLPTFFSVTGNGYTIHPEEQRLISQPQANVSEVGSIRLVYRTSNEHLWIGSTDGLIQRQSNRKRFAALWDNFPDLQAAPTIAGLGSTSNHQLLIGTHDAKVPGKSSLHLVNLQTGHYTNLGATIPEYGRVGSAILSIASSDIHENRFFISTLNQGILDISLSRNVDFSTITLPDSISLVQTISHVNEYTLILSTNQGALYTYDMRHATIKSIRMPKPLSERIRIARLYRDGNLWYASFNQFLYRLSQNFESAAPVTLVSQIGSPGLIYDIENDGEGNLYIASETGLYHTHARLASTTYQDTLKLEQVSPTQGQAIQSIHIEESGALWLIDQLRVYRLRSDHTATQTFTEIDGLPTFSRSSLLSTFATAGNNIFFGTDTHGVLHSNTQDVSTPSLLPPLRLTRFTSRGLPAQHFATQRDTLHIAYADKAFSLEFALLNFDVESQQHYEYRLFPFEESWHSAETRRYANYTNLSPGTYTFEVRAQDATGSWSDLPLSRTLIITPPWYRTAQAYFAFVAGLLGLGLFIAWSVKQRHAREIALLQREAHLAEEKRLQDVEAHQRLQAVDALRRTFLENMSHELRTPLAGIVAAGDILAYEDLGELDEMVEIIQESGNRLEKTLLSILEFSEVHTLNELLYLEPFELNALTQHVCMDKASEAEAKKLAIHVSASPNPIRLYTSKHYMTQVLSHLVDNAIKFTPVGQIDVTIEQHPNTVSIIVRDTGIGMAENFTTEAFAPFKQESAGTDRSFEGCGLGLSITKHALLLMDGDIRIKSKKGQGTAVHVTLPHSVRQAEPAPVQEAEIQPLYYSKAS
ncbi:MAG: hypothetical protein RhofKO_03330 [Rhodothermales bacterium]